MMTANTVGARTSLDNAIRQIYDLMSRRQFGQAEAAARQLLPRNILHPEVNYALGCALYGQNRSRDAERFLRTALNNAPQNAEYMATLGQVLLDLYRIAEAEDLLNRAVRKAPRNFLISLSLARFHAGIGRSDLAEPEFRKALRPDQPPATQEQIRVGWMKALANAGRFEAAEAEIRKNIGNGTASPREVALLTTLRKFDRESPESLMVESELKKQGLTDEEQYNLLHAKAAIHEASGQHSDAYATWLQAKASARMRFDMASMTKMVDHCLAHVTAERIASLQERLGDCDFEPIYVVGLPRSGTTLTESILSAHSAVASAGELTVVRDCVTEMIGNRTIESLADCLEHADAAAISAFRRKIETAMKHLAPGKARIIDKLPNNFLYLHFILALFPKARIIHCHRDPADNFISALQAPLSPNHAYCFDPDTYAAYYVQYARLMRHWHGIFPDALHALDYAKLVTAPERTIPPLLQFLGLDWEEACLHPENRTSSVNTLSFAQVRNPINARSLGRWKNYEQQLGPLNDKLRGVSPAPESEIAAVPA